MNQDANRYVADALSAVVLAAGRVETPQERAVLRITAGSLVQLVFEPPLVAEAPVTAVMPTPTPGQPGHPDYVPPEPITAPPAPGGQQTLPGAAPAPPAPFNAAAAFAPPAAAPVAAVPAQVAAGAAPAASAPPVAAAAPAAEEVVLSPFAGM